ncbi:hypothetical protein GJ496_009023 [Pomphorhynchus laevis]|nr:hypothetical protein GJ496_009023 [Pomphorhynchus laevis]
MTNDKRIDSSIFHPDTHYLKYKKTGNKTKTIVLLCFYWTLYLNRRRCGFQLTRFQIILFAIYSLRIYCEHILQTRHKILEFIPWIIGSVLLFVTISISAVNDFRRINVGFTVSLLYKLLHYAIWIASQNWSSRISAFICMIADIALKSGFSSPDKYPTCTNHYLQLTLITFPLVFLFVRATIKRLALLVVVTYVFIFMFITNIEPFVWLLGFIFEYGIFYRPLILLFWIFISVMFITIAYLLRPPRLSKTEARKIYHFAVTIIVSSGLLFDPALLKVSLSGALFIIELIEACRYYRSPILGTAIHFIFSPFLTNTLEPESAELSPITLLLGVLYPLMYESCENLNSNSNVTKMPLYVYTGVMSTGVGDAFASVIGYRYGKLRWPQRKRTVEVIISRQFKIFVSGMTHLMLIFGLLVSSMFEAFSKGDDNFFGAVILYPFLRIAFSNNTVENNHSC